MDTLYKWIAEYNPVTLVSRATTAALQPATTQVAKATGRAADSIWEQHKGKFYLGVATLGILVFMGAVTGGQMAAGRFMRAPVPTPPAAKTNPKRRKARK